MPIIFFLVTPGVSGLIFVFDWQAELISITGDAQHDSEKTLMSWLKVLFDCDTKAKSGQMDSDASAIAMKCHLRVRYSLQNWCIQNQMVSILNIASLWLKKRYGLTA